ncbi:hypothetical protein HFD88_001668 [Aspergillus terreus]|nr:hypothetical protein HFD88_001668 [Aspergillus terreus]
MAAIREVLARLNKAADAFTQALDSQENDDCNSLREPHPWYNLSLLSAQALEAQGELIATAEAIIRLAKGPQACLASYSDKSAEMGTLKALIKLGVPEKVPLKGSITYHELSAALPIAPELLQRLVRLASLAGFLVEDPDGAVRHSAMSSVFLRDPPAADAARFLFDVDMRSSNYFYDSIKLDPSGRDNRCCPVSLAFQKDDKCEAQAHPLTIWDILERDAALKAQFHSSMVAVLASPSHALKHVPNAYDWGKFKTLVDVGGSQGQASLAIAEKYEGIHIIVQDLPEVVEMLQPSRATEAGRRLDFQAHDFFTEQRTVADGYFLRQVLHDWPDKEVQTIIKNLVPACRSGTKLLVMDIVIPVPGSIPWFMEKQLRSVDVSMFSLCSAKERTLEEFRTLVESCDARFRFEGVCTPPGSGTSMLSWVFDSGSGNARADEIPVNKGLLDV